MNIIEKYLDHCFNKFFSALVIEKGLSNFKKEVSGMAGMYEAHGKNVVIRLVNERGCVNYDLFSKHRSRCSCDGELLAEILSPRDEKERKRSVRRLSLEDQTKLFIKNWEIIENMMCDNNALDTEKILNRLGVERSKIIFK